MEGGGRGQFVFEAGGGHIIYLQLGTYLLTLRQSADDFMFYSKLKRPRITVCM